MTNAGRLQLIVFTGVPGTGKSRLAERAAQMLGIPVFAKDVVEAALWRSGVGRDQNSGWIAYELLTALADAQLRAGRSVILDSVCGSESLRQQWRDLASRVGASRPVIECVCSDEHVHRDRMSSRERGIPGWYELTWEEVERVRSSYAPWQEERLVLDAVRPFEENCRELVVNLRAVGTAT